MTEYVRSLGDKSNCAWMFNQGAYRAVSPMQAHHPHAFYYRRPPSRTNQRQVHYRGRPATRCLGVKPGARLPAYLQGRVALSFRASFGDLSPPIVPNDEIYPTVGSHMGARQCGNEPTGGFTACAKIGIWNVLFHDFMNCIEL